MADYNGWTNRETWVINLWFNPESESDIDMIEEQVNDDYENLPDYMRDLVDIQAINWDELRESVADNEED